MNDIKNNVIIDKAIEELQPAFKHYEEIALFNQEKVLNAFRQAKVALRHFAGTTGYGYDDIGRDTLGKVFASTFGAEAAIVSPQLVNGTHAIATALYGLLRPNDTVLSITGAPYDTLSEVISGNGNGSLKDFNIGFEKVDLSDNGLFDYEKIKEALSKAHSLIFIQRSRGYNWRNAFGIDELKKVIDFIRKFSDKPIVIDNCYGEFTDKKEPTEVGANLIMGSLIKNPGGGLAPTGGYIAGDASLVEKASFRLTVPGIGCEVGSCEQGYRMYYQGLFVAPHVTLQAVKSALLFAKVFNSIGYKALPAEDRCGDIICSVEFDCAQKLIDFVQSVQECSPVDSFVTPYPWDMPGYDSKVIMAAGTFVQGASIELSADSPIKAPYIAYIQGGLTFEHSLIALKNCLSRLP